MRTILRTMLQIQLSFFAVAICFGLALCVVVPVHASTGNRGTVSAETFGKMPLAFVPNQGQLDEKIRYYEQGVGHGTYFTRDGVYLSLSHQSATNKTSEMVGLSLKGSKANPEITAEGEQPGRINYFVGKNSKNWKTDIHTFESVRYKDVYPGTDIRFYGNNSQFEYDIVLDPGADPSKVRMAYTGVEGVTLSADGGLEIKLKHGSIQQKKPYLYQDINGKRIEVSGAFQLFPKKDGTSEYGFQVAAYDKTKPLIIDPVVLWASYLGGSSASGVMRGVATDSTGNVYVTGQFFNSSTVTAADFPSTPGAYQTTDVGLGGGYQAFVAKFDSNGILLYSTYLAGSGNDNGYGIAADSNGNAYITGTTTYTVNFPTTTGAFQTTAGTGTHGFVTKLNPTGTSLVYSTLIGGNGTVDDCRRIAVDAAGSAYITCSVDSTNLPASNTKSGSYDAYVAKLNPAGSALVYSSYLGGSGSESVGGIYLDSASNLYISGTTSSSDFPVIGGVYSNTGYSSGAFWAKFNTDGVRVLSGIIGGTSSNDGNGITLDSSNNIYLTGSTSSADFPSTSGAYAANSSPAFVVKLDPTGVTRQYSLLFGGSAAAVPHGIAIDSSGNAIVVGSTSSTDFPLVSPLQASMSSSQNKFVTQLDPTGTILFSTYLGSGGLGDIAMAAADNIYITGATYTLPANQVHRYGSGSSSPSVLKLFVASSASLYVAIVGNGTVKSTISGIDCGTTCSFSYSAGAVVTLKAVPTDSSFFSSWSGGACNGNLSTTCMVTMDAAQSVTAHFTSTPPVVATWSKSLGNPASDETATIVQQTTDGGYVMAGSYGDNGGTTKDFWIVKLNADGTVAWQQRYNARDNNFGITGIEGVSSIQQIADGGYIVAGVTQINGGSRGWILRLDAVGNHVWNRAFGEDNASYDSIFSVLQTTDGGFIATGGTGGYVWLIKLTGNGTTTWQKALGAGFGVSINQSADGGYLIGGQTVVHKVSSDGAVAWRLGFDTPGSTWISSIVQNADGTCTVAGYSTIGSAGWYDFWVARIDGNGTVLWQKSYGSADSAGADYGSSLYPTFDGGYVVAGYTTGAGAGMQDILLIRLNSTGDLQWAHTYGGPSFDSGAGVQQTVDGGFILVGQTYVGTGLYKNDAWIMKLDSLGQMSGSAASAIGTPTLTVADPGIPAAITIPVATTVTSKFAKTYAATAVVPTDTPAAVTFALPTYTVNFTVAPANTGTLTGTTSQTAITSGGSTTAVTATANSGYHFVNWTGTGGFTTTTTNPLTVTNVTANMTITANFAADSAACTNPAASSSAWWQGEGNAVDQIGANNGTLNGAGVTFAPGKVGQAFSFNGSSSVSVPDGIIPATSRAFSVSAWVNPADVASNKVIFYGGANGGEFLLDYWAPGYDFSIKLSDGNFYSVGAFTPTAGVWNHLVAVRNGTTITLWVDGVQQATATIPDLDLYKATSTAYPSRIGADYTASGRWVGLIDEVQLYTKALSLSEIVALYNAGNGFCELIPRNGEPHASMTAPLSVTFSVPMSADSINATNFTLSDGMSAVPGAVSYDVLTRTGTFTPSASLTANIRYTATLTTGITNSLGTPIAAPFAWTFINDTLPPSGSLTAIPGNRQIVLSWKGFVDASIIASYKLVSSDIGLPENCYGTALYEGSATTFVDSGIPVNTSRYYGLCATDAAGNVSTTYNASATTFAPSTLLWETFDLGTLPAGWSMANYRNDGDWRFQLGENPTGGSGGFAFDRDRSSAALLTPAMNMTALSNPVLEFKSAGNWNLSPAQVTVDVSTDGGITWNTTPLFQTTTPYSATTKQFSLAALLGTNRNNVVIRFNFIDIDGGSPIWAIDDVKVYDQMLYGHILDANTVALWRMDETAASANAVDETGNYTLTQFGNPDAVSGRINNGRLLDGTSKFFQKLGDANFGAAMNGDWTYEGWAYIDPAYNAGAVLFIYNGLAFSLNQPDTILAEVAIIPDSGGNRKLNWQQWQTTGTYTQGSSAATLQPGQYYHLAVSRTAQGGNLFTYRMYVNGVLDTTTTDVAGLSSPVTGAAHYIGLGNYTDINGFGVGTAKFNGRLDDTRISKVARSDAEILASSLRAAAIVDTVAPVIAGFTLPPASLTTRTIAITTFTATDAVGVTGYLITESATAPLASDLAWSGTVPTSFTCRTWGNITLYAYAKDAAGNISAPVTGVVKIGPTDGIVVPAANKLEPKLPDALKSLNFAMKVGPAPTQSELDAGDVAPLINGVPQPDGKITLGDTIVTLRRVIGL